MDSVIALAIPLSSVSSAAPKETTVFITDDRVVRSTPWINICGNMIPEQLPAEGKQINFVKRRTDGDMPGTFLKYFA